MLDRTGGFDKIVRKSCAEPKGYVICGIVILIVSKDHRLLCRLFIFDEIRSVFFVCLKVAIHFFAKEIKLE